MTDELHDRLLTDYEAFIKSDGRTKADKIQFVYDYLRKEGYKNVTNSVARRLILEWERAGEILNPDDDTDFVDTSSAYQVNTTVIKSLLDDLDYARKNKDNVLKRDVYKYLKGYIELGLKIEEIRKGKGEDECVVVQAAKIVYQE